VTAALGVNLVNETLGITIELKVTSEATNFITQILDFLAYGGSSFLKTLFYLLQIVRAEVIS
jgi:hypothetical protein